MGKSLLNNTTPTHIAIIMDGNRRWAVGKKLPYIDGHKEALKRVEEIIQYAAEKGVKYLTLWAWSTKNWKRSPDFIQDIITLFRENLNPNGLFKKAIEKGAQLHHIGKLDGFPEDIRKKVTELLMQKPEDKKIDVSLAVGYEGRDELVRALKKIVQDQVSVDQISCKLIDSYLDTAGQPDVDLIIRTGGERRTSGFLIWQAADAELYFTPTYMPDFTVDEFQKALDDFAGRERRLGGDSQKY